MSSLNYSNVKQNVCAFVLISLTKLLIAAKCTLFQLDGTTKQDGMGHGSENNRETTAGPTLETPLYKWRLKEVLRRENRGLKVYPVDGSLVFSMTGTYFLFVLSMQSGLIF